MYQVTPHRYVRQTYNFSKKIPFLVTALVCISALSLTNVATAQGVEAGTIVPNIATVTYSMGNVPQDPIESSPSGNNIGGIGNGQVTAFVVDRKIDLLVTGNTNSNVSPGDSQAEVTFTLQNQGNAIQEFSLLPDSLLTTDNFDVSNCNVQVVSVSGTPLAGVALPSSGNIKLSPDQQANISVSCDIPLDNLGAPIVTGHTSLIGLIATTEKNEDGSDTVEITNANDPSTVETIFTDGAGSDDETRDASHSARRTYIATSSSAAPELKMDKTILSVVDSDNGNTAVTGSEVTYKIHVKSTGTGTIENLVISDLTPDGMTYKTNSIKIDSVVQTDISDVVDNTDYGISTANTATINLGNFAAGSQYEILLTYIIN